MTPRQPQNPKIAGAQWNRRGEDNRDSKSTLHFQKLYSLTLYLRQRSSQVPKTAERLRIPRGSARKQEEVGFSKGRNFVKTNFWPRSSFPFQGDAKKMSRVPTGVHRSTKEHNCSKGKEWEILPREFIAGLSVLFGIHLISNID